MKPVTFERIKAGLASLPRQSLDRFRLWIAPPETVRFSILPTGHAGSLFLALLGTILSLGLAIMPLRDVTIAYTILLAFHQLVGGITLAWLFLLGVWGHFRATNFFWAALRLPIYLGLILTDIGILFFTAEMLVATTVALFLADWYVLRWTLKRLGTTPEDIIRCRKGFTDFAVTASALLSGLMVLNTSPFLRIMHMFHGLAMPAILLWFLSKRFPHLSARQKWATGVAYGLFFAMVGGFYYYKQIWLGDDTDLSRRDVMATVASASEASRLKTKVQAFPSVENCGDCHPVQAFQWSGSTHRFSTNNRLFKKVVQLFIEDRGVEQVRFCINCHDPASAISATAETTYASGKIDNPDGVSCVVCHSISAYDQTHGLGRYTVKIPVDYPYPWMPTGDGPWNHHGSILQDPRMHLRGLHRGKMYREGEFCVACHRFGAYDSHDQRDAAHLGDIFREWEESSWHDRQNCIDCHMPRFQMDTDGYGVYDHRVMGINADIGLYADQPRSVAPALADAKQFMQKYIDGTLAKGLYDFLAKPSDYVYLKNPNKEISQMYVSFPFGIFRFLETQKFLAAGPMLDLKVELPAEVSPDGSLPVTATTHNARVGHSYPGGLPDVQQTWLESVLTDAGGQVVARTGALDADGELDPAVPILGMRALLDADGNELYRHEFWKAARAVDARLLKADQSVVDVLPLRIGSVQPGRYRLDVHWNYRKMRPKLADWLWEPGTVRFEIRRLTWVTIELEIDKRGKIRVISSTRAGAPVTETD